MMTSTKFVFCVICLFLGELAQKTYQSSTVHQETGFISANVGQSVTLKCFYEGKSVPNFFWYKQSLGRKPELVSKFYIYDKNGTLLDEYQNNPRFSLDTGNGKNHLTISNLQISDSASYYCASSFLLTFEFAEGVTVSVKGSGLNIKPSVSQSVSESIQTGGSVTLNCSVQTGTCDGEHSVYWFTNSEDYHPGFIYTHGDRNDQCEKKPDTQTHTCVYNLPLRNLNLSHTGTYYCAVASCGHIVFGNGTQVDIKEKESLVLVYFLSGAVAFTIILILLLGFCLYIINKRNSQCAGSHTSSSTTNTESCEENVHYAALSVTKTNRSRRQREDREDTCVYSSVKNERI